MELIYPDTFHHMSNAGSLLLRIATECREMDTALSDRAIDLAKTYCDTLASYWQGEQWDMADETLKRLAEPAFTVGKDCLGARDIYLTISKALGYPATGESSEFWEWRSQTGTELSVAESAWDDLIITNHYGFINDGFDPSIWTVDGVPWLGT
jgi:hypothetical protein